MLAQMKAVAPSYPLINPMSHSEAPEGKAKAEQLAPPHAAKTPKGQVKADTRLSPAALQTALPPVPPKAGPWHLVPLGPLAALPPAPNKAGSPGPPAALPKALPKASPPGLPTTPPLVHPDAWPLEPPKAGPLGPPPLVVRRRKAPPPAWQLLPQAPYVGEATKGQGCLTSAHHQCTQLSTSVWHLNLSLYLVVRHRQLTS